MKTRERAQRLLSQILEPLREPAVQAYLGIPAQIDSEDHAVSVMSYILATFLKKMSVGLGEVGVRGQEMEEERQEQNGQSNKEELEEQLMRVFVRCLVKENMGAKEKDGEKIEKGERRSLGGEGSMVSIITERDRTREQSKIQMEENEDGQNKALKALSRLSKLQNYLISPSHKRREPQQNWDTTMGKDFYIEQNKYLKQMQHILRSKLDVFQVKSEDTEMKTLERKLEEKSTTLMKKEAQVKRLQEQLTKREQALNSKESQFIRRQKLRS